MNRHNLGSAPNYTTAALITLGVNVFCAMYLLWATLGFAAVLFVAFAANVVLTRIDRHRTR
ncbi:hypothetical protein CLV78_102721 [Aliiruegeria haliotis]|uniref:Uncharacterized protein n=1 Tax=Aliiruegeria haliotis TaxID=1280846 RepID=A0A2T0RWJ0_9RHOB|nr:hypothetical protein [Aliiruegeria haliotis]PRY25541.1 hypothetical protein CLV78_102721 [Aliiruegeria haliotis]